MKTQEQRFFNSIIVGIFDGSPSWQDINIKNPEIAEILNENVVEYLNRTFGILTLNGDESMFAIDGQHRSISIRAAVEKYASLGTEEISVIFLAHKNTVDGKIRTRRLFSTLNKYAKPVSQSEIIGLSEDNNCAVITRSIIDNFPLFKNAVLINKNRSISIENNNAFTNIIVLYDIIERLLTDKSVYGIKVTGHNKQKYITNRVSDKQLNADLKTIENYLLTSLPKIPSLNSFFKTRVVNRKSKSCSLLFRPIGQSVFFDVFKVALDYKKQNKCISYFRKDTFNLKNPIWEKVFLDAETGNISTEKAKQRFASLLILEHIGVPVKRTAKDIQTLNNYKFSANDI